jgi:hypothetical protein
MSEPPITPMQKHIPNVMESKINSTGHNFGKQKAVQDIKYTKLLTIYAMDLMTNEELFKAFM